MVCRILRNVNECNDVCFCCCGGMSALFDFTSLLVVILLFICTTTYLRSLYPTIFSTGEKDDKHDGLRGFCWKASRIGERVSLYVAVGCVLMAFHVLFLH